MLRAIWFIFRLALLSLLVAWVIEHPGTVVINLEPYEIKTSTSVLLFAVVFVVVIFALLYRFYRAFISVPKTVRHYREIQAKENGYQAITKGLAAIAAGDARSAQLHAKRAKKLLPTASLTGLLTAQSALLNNNEDIAKLEFEALLDDKNAAFFGIRGLMNLALKEQNNNRLIDLMQKAEHIAPKQPWVIEQLFEFQACNAQWEKAEQTLTKAIKLGIIDRTIGNKHRQAILLARAFEAEQQDILHAALNLSKKSYQIDPSFIPAAAAYASFLQQTNKWRAAVKVVEKSWIIYQHPDLIKIWNKLMLPPKGENLTEQDKLKHSYQWTLRLHKLAPFGKVSNNMIGKAAMKAKKWDEAREFFKISGNYRRLAKLEIKAGSNESIAREWLEMANDTKEKMNWVCHSCGYTCSEWLVLCDSCGIFNSFEWTTPQLGSYGYGTLTHHNHDNDIILEPPSAA